MNENNYFHKILHYFKSLDIDQLQLHLKEDHTYQDAPKAIFLNEVRLIFEAFIRSGDRELIAYPGRCVADCSLCDNCGKSGFRLVGDQSGNYLDLIFEVAQDDVTDIYSCSRFESNKKIEGLSNRADIEINEDDKVTFPKTAAYELKLSEALAAYKEIMIEPKRVLSFEELCFWLDKHAIVYEKIGGYSFFNPVMKWSPFLRLYCDLKEIQDYILGKGERIQQALHQLQESDNEAQHLAWVLHFKSIYQEAPIDLKYALVKEGDYYVLQGKDTIYFYGLAFASIDDFMMSFQGLESELLAKYSTYTREEEEAAYHYLASERSGADITSLEFHLNKRRVLEEIGITLPFCLGNAPNVGDS